MKGVLMVAERHMILELSAQTRAKANAQETTRVSQNEEFHLRRARLKGQHRREALPSPAAVAHRQ
jgi:hypothetical protein